MHLILLITGNILAGTIGCFLGMGLGTLLNGLLNVIRADQTMEDDNGLLR